MERNARKSKDYSPIPASESAMAKGRPNPAGGRGSRIRTCDLLVPNQTRYQTALCPAKSDVRTDRETARAGVSIHAPRNASKDRGYFPISGEATRSPGAMPILRAVPAMTSSTKRTGPFEGMTSVDIGLAFSAMRRMRPSALMKIMSSGM
jgi:hypothetical protein